MVIGVFDSGVGGLGVLGEIRRLLPDVDLLYLADRGRAPYGRRPIEEVRRFSEQITVHLLDHGADLIVVACNSASAVALNHLRQMHPRVQFVGMEPAIKPALDVTRSGIIAVLATAATFQGELFASLIDRYGESAQLIPRVCDGWVELVESGRVNGLEAERSVRRHLGPVIAAGADTLVLGCTHYPFLSPAIRAVVGPNVQLIDPAPAVALQAQRLAKSVGTGALRFFVTGDPTGVPELVAQLTGFEPSVEVVTFDQHG